MTTAPFMPTTYKVGVCVVCSCTWDHPCPGGCSWANKSENLCTRCARAVPTVGQVWEDTDPKHARGSRRRLTIRNVGPLNVLCDELIEFADQVRPPRQRATIIRLERFRPRRNGYKLIGRAL